MDTYCVRFCCDNVTTGPEYRQMALYKEKHGLYDEAINLANLAGKKGCDSSDIIDRIGKLKQKPIPDWERLVTPKNKTKIKTQQSSAYYRAQSNQKNRGKNHKGPSAGKNSPNPDCVAPMSESLLEFYKDKPLLISSMHPESSDGYYKLKQLIRSGNTDAIRHVFEHADPHSKRGADLISECYKLKSTANDMIMSYLDPNIEIGYEYLLRNKTDSLRYYTLQIVKKIDFNNEIGIKSWSVLQEYMSLEEVFYLLSIHIPEPFILKLEGIPSENLKTIIYKEDAEDLLNFIDINSQ